MTFQPKRMLVTGGAGFIGSNFVHYMLRTDPGVQIVNLDLLTYAGDLRNLEDLPDPARHEFVQGDICDAGLVAQLISRHDVDTVVHFAAESHVDRSITGPGEFVRTNVVGTYTLLEACRRYWLGEHKSGPDRVRFHHISTDEVYGSLGPDDPPFTESTPYAPNSPYSASKASSDHLVRAYHHTYGLPTTTSNCSNNYGPRQHGEKFIPTVIRHCVEQKPIPVYGNGSNIRDWLYVEDHCVGIDAVIRRGKLGRTYNIGGANERSNVEICKLICHLMDAFRPESAPHERLIEFVSDRPGHDWRYAVDIRMAREELGWRPISAFEYSLGQMIDGRLTAGG